MFIQKRFAKGIYSHETALYLHGLSDTTPFILHDDLPARLSILKKLKSNPFHWYGRNGQFGR